MRPSPIPPKHARLKKLSVTQIKDLVRDPYKIYASVILNLKKLEPLGKQADAIERGNTIHTILEEFIKQTKNEFPEDASGLFMKITNNVLKKTYHGLLLDVYGLPECMQYLLHL